MDIKFRTIIKVNRNNFVIYLFLIVIVLSSVSCKVTKSRIMFINCSKREFITDSREGYQNKKIRMHYLSRHTPDNKKDKKF